MYKNLCSDFWKRKEFDGILKLNRFIYLFFTIKNNIYLKSFIFSQKELIINFHLYIKTCNIENYNKYHSYLNLIKIL